MHNKHYYSDIKKARERALLWRKNNPEKSRAIRKRIRKNNLNYKIAENLRCRLNMALTNNQKVGSAVRDLGCSIEELKVYLEKQFYPNPETGEEMTWDKWSRTGWHIDHIKPLSSFDLTKRNQFLKACHYSNLQPLWAKENLTKSDKIIK